MLPFFIIGVILCISLNLLVVLVMWGKRKELTQIDLIMLSMAVSDLLQAILGYPVQIHAFIYEEMMNEKFCAVSGFSVTFLALTSIFHFTGLSIERCVVIRCPLIARERLLNRKTSLCIIIPSWGCGLFWAILPLAGWSKYEVDKFGKRLCSLDLNDTVNNGRSFAFCLLVFGFLIPITIIGVTTTVTLVELRKFRCRVVTFGLSNDELNARRQREVQQTIMAFVMITMFLLAWTPYAVCVFMISYYGRVDDTMHTYAAVIAKTSTFYNPLIYILFLKNFRARIMMLFQCRNGQVVPT